MLETWVDKSKNVLQERLSILQPEPGLGTTMYSCLLLGKIKFIWVHVHEGVDDGLLTFTVHGFHHQDRALPGSQG